MLQIFVLACALTAYSTQAQIAAPIIPPLPSNGPILPVSPVLPIGSVGFAQSVAHVHGYVEKPVEYFYKSYHLHPTVTNVDKLEYVPETRVYKGLLKVPEVKEVKSVAYEPKPYDVTYNKYVPVEKIVHSTQLVPKMYTTTEYHEVPHTQVVQNVVYKPHEYEQYRMQYLPREQIMQGTHMKHVEQLVPSFQVVPKVYTGTGVKYMPYQYPVTRVNIEPKAFALKNLQVQPIEEKHLGLKLFPKDLIIKTYAPITVPNLDTQVHAGPVSETPVTMHPIPPSPEQIAMAQAATAAANSELEHNEELTAPGIVYHGHHHGIMPHYYHHGNPYIQTLGGGHGEWLGGQHTSLLPGSVDSNAWIGKMGGGDLSWLGKMGGFEAGSSMSPEKAEALGKLKELLMKKFISTGPMPMLPPTNMQDAFDAQKVAQIKADWKTAGVATGPLIPN